MKYFSYITLAGLISLYGCKSTVPLETVPQVDITRYSGTWYEIARITHWFEKGLEKVSATYTPRQDGKITVLNQGCKKTDLLVTKTAKGIARVPDPAFPGRLKVQFFWPFEGNYWIIDLDDQYQHALVGDPSRKYLWILSRTKKMDTETYNRLINIAKKAGFDTSKLDLIIQ